MKKLTSSVLLVVLSSSFAVINAQKKENDTIKEQSIGEVVITGALGLQKKADAQTSAMQVISSDKITAAGNPSAIFSLQGKVSGVSITNTNSSVTGTPKITMRGMRSLTGNNNALVVIDNVISSASALQQLPPELIESMNILKGSQAAALYGSDGVNGVVLVTTKKGSKGKMKITYNGTVDFETVAWIPKRQRNYGQGWYGLKINVENGAWGPAFNSALGGQTVGYGIPLYDYDGDGHIDVNADDELATPDDPAMIQSTFAPYGKDNIKEFFKTGTIYQNGITASVGDENGYLMMSLDHMQREFIVEDDKLKRTSAFLKAGTKFGKWSFDAVVNYTRQTTNTTDAGLYEDLLFSSVDVPITKWKDLRDNGYAWNIFYQNPYWKINHIRNNATSNRLNLIGSVGYKINKNIDVLYRSNLQYLASSSNQWNDGWSSILITDAKAVTSSYYQSNSDQTKYYGDLLINFNYDLTDDLNLKLNLGHNFQNFSYTNTSAGGTGIIIPGLYQVWNLSNPATPYGLDNTRGSYNSQAVFANLDLAYKDYLFLTATARNEWNSVLPSGERSYFFPSVGLSFVPTKAFDFGGDILNYMKVYASIMGTANASSVGNYSIRNYYGLGAGFPFTASGGLSFLSPTSQTDQNIRPEKVAKKELGISLGFLDNRILINGSVYQDDTTDMITNRTTSTTSGVSNVLTNIGKLRNRGIDADITVTPIKKSDFRWDIGANFTTYQTEVLEVAPDTDRVAIGGTSLVGVYAIKGEKGLVLMGTDFVRDDQGRVIVNATNGRPSVTSTLQNLGRINPRYTFGFNTSVNYKGIKLSATADWRVGGKMTSETIQNMAYNGLLEEAGSFDRNAGFIMPNSVYLSNGQYVPNTSVAYQYNGYTGEPLYDGVEYYYQQQFGTVGSNQVVSASYFKIREIALSYSFSANMLKNSGLTGLTIGVHARNPFVKFSDSNRNYADPESAYTTGNAQGYAASSQYPAIKSYGVSVNVNF
ncbi:MAG: SusC/RagA family TonB-linked outer membrane protein [Chryseobacterium sp.]|jgi:TonB-linked SusC/RagA family outer membrane protein|uniref:SusC/RagA family TonB-linked outer membrane protein n=1 Tax=Chryseobacterium sp. TaxID=1871047 RepID=UPI00282DE19B|nr:SusC/RagA family TonB-linked outer membrane protein [Chryseobacterium sp.]MDR2237792.1 SusC/RagA family TonB-linked outer membrane protein [Chryseobacterium sp.]